MSDEPSKHEREDDHDHQGVVETIREEIEDVVEEVVEHVPQPVRWTVGKLARLVTLVFLGLAVLGIGFLYTSVWAWTVVGFAFTKALQDEPVQTVQ